LTKNKLFTREVTDEWSDHPTLPSEIINIEIDNNSGIYVNSEEYLLYSTDRFTTIDTLTLPPQALFGLDPKRDLFVLDDEVLILIGNGFDNSYYTTNSGDSWSVFSVYFYFEVDVKLIGNEIYITSIFEGLNLTRVNIETHEVLNINTDTPFQLGEYPYPLLLDNGTAIIQSGFGNNPVVLYSLDTLSDDVEFYMDASDLFTRSSRVVIGNSIYLFDHNEYQVVRDKSFTNYNLTGLSEGYHSMQLSNSGYFMSVTGNSKLYKSTEKIEQISNVESEVIQQLHIVVSPNPANSQFNIITISLILDFSLNLGFNPSPLVPIPFFRLHRNSFPEIAK